MRFDVLSPDRTRERVCLRSFGREKKINLALVMWWSHAVIPFGNVLNSKETSICQSDPGAPFSRIALCLVGANRRRKTPPALVQGATTCDTRNVMSSGHCVGKMADEARNGEENQALVPSTTTVSLVFLNNKAVSLSRLFFFLDPADVSGFFRRKLDLDCSLLIDSCAANDKPTTAVFGQCKKRYQIGSRFLMEIRLTSRI